VGTHRTGFELKYSPIGNVSVNLHELDDDLCCRMKSKLRHRYLFRFRLDLGREVARGNPQDRVYSVQEQATLCPNTAV
jgi:hypothetical protein